ncbi:MAG TPA: hypothetical protein VH478_14635 [Trebonia sp.]|nr:hypothetical protein [Trebonia sp.]
MSRFENQLFDDLMREHGPSLAGATRPARDGHRPRPALAVAGVAGLAIAGTAAGLLATGGGTPAYAVTKNPDGTITLAVHQSSGIAGANARLHQLGAKQVVVVPAKPGCPQLAPPAHPAGHPALAAQTAGDGTVTVDAQSLPGGDIVVIGVSTSGQASLTVGGVTSPPAPACVGTPPAPPASGSGS